MDTSVRASTAAPAAPVGFPERRGSHHLRKLFVEAYEVLKPFFDPATDWGGPGHEHLAFRALHERFPDLSTDEVFVLVTAAKRVLREGGLPAPWKPAT